MALFLPTPSPLSPPRPQHDPEGLKSHSHLEFGSGHLALLWLVARPSDWDGRAFSSLFSVSICLSLRSRRNDVLMISEGAEPESRVMGGRGGVPLEEALGDADTQPSPSQITLSALTRLSLPFPG